MLCKWIEYKGDYKVERTCEMFDVSEWKKCECKQTMMKDWQNIDFEMYVYIYIFLIMEKIQSEIETIVIKLENMI